MAGLRFETAGIEERARSDQGDALDPGGADGVLEPAWKAQRPALPGAALRPSRGAVPSLPAARSRSPSSLADRSTNRSATALLEVWGLMALRLSSLRSAVSVPLRLARSAQSSSTLPALPATQPVMRSWGGETLMPLELLRSRPEPPLSG